MRKIMLLVLCIGLLALGGTALAFSWSYSTSSHSTFATTPYSYSSADAFGFASGPSPSTFTWSSSTAESYNGGTSFYSSASAEVCASSGGWGFDCDPEPCDDIDQDEVCDEDDICPGGNDLVDSDQDGVPDDCDNCDFDPNPDQANNDNDEFGDVCDNCLDLDNPFQDDTDRDGLGDLCDPCPDNDPECVFDVECPCGAPPPPHGPYVNCIVHWAQELVDDGIIEPGIGTCYGSIAGQSDCGMPGWQEGISEIPIYQEGECVVD